MMAMIKLLTGSGTDRPGAAGGWLAAALLLAFLHPAPVGAADKEDAPAALRKVIEAEWAARLEAWPLLASRLGVHDYDGRLADVSPPAQDRRLAGDRAFQARLAAIPADRLDAEGRLNRDLLGFVVDHRVAAAAFREWRMPFLSDSGFFTALPREMEGTIIESAADARHYRARLEAVPAYFEQQIANMRRGLDDGFTQPRVILDAMAPMIDAEIVGEPEQSRFWQPVANMKPDIAGLDAAGRRAFEAAVKKTIMGRVVPAYRGLLAFFKSQYLPRARTAIGASALPRGDAYYRYLVGYYTTLDISPEEVHALGLREVARIRGEMETVMREAGFKGDFAAFVAFLRGDPRFYAKTPEELLRRAAWIAKQIDGQLPAFFGRLPRQPYGVRPVPASIAPTYTTGRYWGAPRGSRHGGYYMVNTYALDQRPLYALGALTLHEAVPGHHLQNALAGELEGVPPFRRILYPHAFGEGWGLYAEKLGAEMGLYDTPYKKFGQLSYEMWRACRLVIDTGIHLMGWSREKARAYMADNTALSELNVRTEIDRYISWPGQALAYKMGELKIIELRRRAEAALGVAFDIRAFHDAVLAAGGLPLGILDARINAFIDRQKAG